MIFASTRFARNCAGASLNQMRGLAETAPPPSRGNAHVSDVTSFGPLPKLPLQDCARTASATRQPVSAEAVASALPKLEFPFSVSALMRVSSFGGETTPYGGGGERRRRVLPRPPPGVSRARASTLSAHPDPTTAAPYRQAPGRRRLPPQAANRRRRPPMADLTLATSACDAIHNLPVAHRADRTLLALDLGTNTGWALHGAGRADYQRHRVLPPWPLRWRRYALSALHQLVDRN